MLELAFLTTRHQNLFFTELVEALRFELDAMGVASSVHFGTPVPPPRPGVAYVLVPPHEWFHLERVEPAPEFLRRAVLLCAEQPGSTHFEENLRLARDAGALFDINRQSVREMRRHGLPARHFQLGHTAPWERHGVRDERDIDVLFMGCVSDRRLRFLAGYGDVMSRWRCRLILSDNSRPNARPSESFVAGEDKWSLLGRSKVILNLHQAEAPYFEWLRIVQAMANGCAVVSERSADFAPLRAGEHVRFGAPESLAFLAQRLLEDPAARDGMAASALELLRVDLPLGRAVGELVEEARRVAAEPVNGPLVLRGTGRRQVDDGIEAVAPEPARTLDGTPEGAVIRAALKDIRLDMLDLRRELEQSTWRNEHAEDPLLAVDLASSAWGGGARRVSVLATVYNYGHHVGRALESVATGRFRDFELIVVDDGSSDDSRDVVRRWIREHEHVPAMLLAHPVNRGLPAARNTALGFARGELALILDADNELYPHALERLVAAAEDDRAASFAYGMLQRFTSDGPVGLVSHFPWDPSLLRRGNYIDALALIRTHALREFGGFTTDRRLHGWEDYDLWCRIAERGGHGRLVPEIVARYRVSRHSMISFTGLSLTTAVSVLSERYPRLMTGAEPSR